MKHKPDHKTRTEKPELRIIHNMARSGGTLIAKCLGSMQDVVLLSEIHPAGTQMFNPLRQAHEWFQLLTPADINQLQIKQNINFVDAIELILKRCQKKNKTLLIRDWSHLDFTAIPFLPSPSYQLTIANTLRTRFTIINTTTVRHPIDQWLSIQKLAVLQNKLSLEMFLRGYREFAEHCVQQGFLRFEDFTQNPDMALTTLCERLKIPFDTQYKQRWSSYSTISGDSSDKTKITPLPHKTIESSLARKFERNYDYQQAIMLLGYDTYFHNEK